MNLPTLIQFQEDEIVCLEWKIQLFIAQKVFAPWFYVRSDLLVDSDNNSNHNKKYPTRKFHKWHTMSML